MPAGLAVGLACAMAMAGGGAQAASAATHQAVPGVAGAVSTVAGGIGGPDPGTSVALETPCAMAYGDGSAYIGSSGPEFEGGTIHGLNPSTGQVTPLAGGSFADALGNGGPALDADLATCGITVDHHGNVIIADNYGSQDATSEIRVVAHSTGTFYGQKMTADDIYDVAGGGSTAGNGIPATTAELSETVDVAVDSAGNLLIADGDEIQVVAAKAGTFYGKRMKSGYIYDVAGDGYRGYYGNGIAATKARLDSPGGVTTDAAGNIVISDTGNSVIRVVADSSGTFYGLAMTAGDIYTVAGGGTSGLGDGGPATSAELGGPTSIAVDSAGNLVIDDPGDSRIRVVAESSGTFYGQAMTAGNIYTIAGDGTPGDTGDGGAATSAAVTPTSMAIDGSGNVLIATELPGVVRVVADSAGTFYGQAMTAGDIYAVAGNGSSNFSGMGGLATGAEIGANTGLAADHAGNLVIDGTGEDQFMVVASSAGTFYQKPMIAKHIYLIAGTGQQGYSGDGGPATKATFNDSQDVTVDAAGNLVIADTGNNVIRVIAERTGTYYGQAMTAGNIYTVAGTGHAGYTGDGGPATSAELDTPDGVAVDASGNLVIADALNNVIRVVAESSGTFYGQAMTAGNIYTVAGTGHAGYVGNGGPASQAELDRPEAVTVDAAGNIVLADTLASVVQVVAASTGTSYGQKMTAGDIYRIAGDHAKGDSGDGGPATKAEMTWPRYLTVDPAGNVLFVEADDDVRMVAGQTGTSYGQTVTAGDIYSLADSDAPAYVSGADGVTANSAGLFYVNSLRGVVQEVSG
ncbi:MAG: hypothetical protein ACRDNF_09190 [Streptosporangiaceae bacterium]